MSEWIPVTERLPENFKGVICCRSDGYMDLGYYVGCYDKPYWKLMYTEWKHYVDGSNHSPGYVVGWMPLPEPMKEEEWQHV
jgi:hypothetical protein